MESTHAPLLADTFTPKPNPSSTPSLPPTQPLHHRPKPPYFHTRLPSTLPFTQPSPPFPSIPSPHTPPQPNPDRSASAPKIVHGFPNGHNSKTPIPTHHAPSRLPPYDPYMASFPAAVTAFTTITITTTITTTITAQPRACVPIFTDNRSCFRAFSTVSLSEIARWKKRGLSTIYHTAVRVLPR